ncbi:MAG: gamma-glutamylcyclotransferase [Candidatus Heimdallarchaeota archaeon]|nr:gamma-glutamylcyclotransferase [Candidatus Heimdallarchaeota archaeon]
MTNNIQESFLLAVYGTLKENFPNYFYYLNPLKPIFRGLVKIPYQMYTNGGFPLLFPAEEQHSVYVEIFEVDEKTLHRIDLLEGVPQHYSRKAIYLDELDLEVFIYIITNREPTGELLSDGFFPKKDSE